MFSKKKRSEIMSKIKSKNTKLDCSMAKILTKSHFTFRQYPKIFGNPDFVVKKKVVVFCDSSFWHGRNWRKLKQKLSRGNNPQYWVSHIAKNKKRDKMVNKKMRNDGYIVVRFWDTDVYKRPEWCIDEIKKALK
ncbi:DUF559 domain-containing protein [Candidatus Nitrosotenuis chungbukensis]|uniref:DUF559 domain-containing protein n=1 Tax=Candidatus Nitrosotenuis chungbukensis TaxID=1353246 RepID=UPI0021009CF2|nr:DUF559 domain-containing protein [Candidatus Nitrosotenuis chungbukensis]